MKSDDSEQQLIEQLGQQLRDSEDELDELTAARLRAARQLALESVGQSRDRYRYFLPAGGFAAASVAILAVMLWSGDRGMPVPALTADDWEMIAEGDLQLIEDFEFYDWLPEEEPAG